ncbi:MAG: SMP-30/gluconolactonase/LRE family protein [Puniceicoccaceae bacterium]
MKQLSAVSAVESHCVLGEGPVWYKNQLWWVDIEQGKLHSWLPGEKSFTSTTFKERIGFAVPDVQDGWILGLQSGIHRIDDLDNEPSLIQSPETEKPGNRFNDAKSDPMGRLWAGTMALDIATGMGALYRLDNATGCRKVVSDTTISNGLAWNTARRKMYFIDTPTQKVTAYDYNPESGDIGNPQTVIQFAKEQGSPDGMTIDSEGMLWVAMWGGHSVLRVDPQRGEVTAKVSVPAPHVTSCTFGGSQLDTLFITTARAGLDEEQLSRFPDSGNIFRVKPQCSGKPVDLFSL